jgi:[amino group carrier protein]-lysine/ornithine hydrolase
VIFLDEAEFLQHLVEIPSFSGQEKRLANFLINYFQEQGIEANIDNVGNVIATVGSGSRTIILTSHMDTVPGDVPVRIENGNLYGRGSVDAKSGLAAFAWLMQEFRNIQNLKIIFIGVVGEESESIGARNILNNYNPDFVINGEPSGWNGITIGYRGCLKLDCSITSEQQHPSTQQSTFLELNNFLNRIINHLGNNAPSFNSATIEIPTVNANQHQANMSIMVRIPTGFDIEEFRNFVDANSNGINITWLEETAPCLAGKNNELVRALMASIREHGEPIFKKKTGTSDMNLFSQWDCPIVSYAAGDSSLDHTPNEHINLEEFRRSVRILRRTIQRLNNISPRPNQ